MTSRAIGLCLLLSLLLLPAGAPGEDKADTKLPRVAVAHPIVREVSDYEVFKGRVEAISTVDVRPRVSGELNRVAFKAGDMVKKGDLLFEIDPRAYQADVNKANVELERAEARIKKATADLERFKKLLRARAISQEEFDAMQCVLVEAKASLEVARASRELARLNLAFTKVTAPISGRIGRANLTEGNVVVADNAKLATICTVDPVHAVFDMDERTLLRLRRLKREHKDTVEPIRMGLLDEKDFPRRCEIDFMDVRVNPATGTIRCRSQLPNKDGELIPGMTIRVRLPTSMRRKAILVSAKAKLGGIVKDGVEMSYFFILDANNQVESRAVTVGFQFGELVEVVSGFKTSDWVVCNPRELPGMVKVQPQKVAMPNADDVPAKPASSAKKDSPAK